MHKTVINFKGYSLIELMLVVSTLGILTYAVMQIMQLQGSLKSELRYRSNLNEKITRLSFILNNKETCKKNLSEREMNEFPIKINSILNLNDKPALETDKTYFNSFSVSSIQLTNLVYSPIHLSPNEIAEGMIDLELVFERKRMNNSMKIGHVIPLLVRLINKNGKLKILDCLGGVSNAELESASTSCSSLGGTFKAAKCDLTSEVNSTKFIHMMCTTIGLRYDTVTNKCSKSNNIISSDKPKGCKGPYRNKPPGEGYYCCRGTLVSKGQCVCKFWGGGMPPAPRIICP